MIVIDAETVRNTVTTYEAIASAQLAFSALHDRRVETPNELTVSPRAGAVLHVKGASIRGSGWIVIKAATGGFDGYGTDGCSLVIDAGTGQIAALIDDHGWLTELRTAGAGALATHLLADPSALDLAVIGTGVQAALHIEAMRALRPDVRVRVAARNVARVRAFASEHHAVACDSIVEAVNDASIIITATSSTVPFLDHLAPGTHVTSIGVDTSTKAELSRSLLESADVVVVDDCTLSQRVGILRQCSTRSAVTLAEVVEGLAGRTSSSQVTVAGLSGLGAQDAAIAELLLHALGVEPSTAGALQLSRSE
jgi:ornithine cyclodeaminase